MIALTKQEKREMEDAYGRALLPLRQSTTSTTQRRGAVLDKNLAVKLGQAEPIWTKAPPTPWYEIPPVQLWGFLGLLLLITIVTKKEE